MSEDMAAPSTGRKTSFHQQETPENDTAQVVKVVSEGVGGEVLKVVKVVNSDEMKAPSFIHRRRPMDAGAGAPSDGQASVSPVPKPTPTPTSMPMPMPMPMPVKAKPVQQSGLDVFPMLPPGADIGPSETTLRLVRDRMKAVYVQAALKSGGLPGDGSQEGRLPGTTVSRDTMEQYLNKGAMLFGRWRMISGSSAESEEDADPIAFVNWLLSLKQSLKPTTWRMYRQSALHWLEGFPGYDAGEAMRLLETDIVEGNSEGEAERRRKLRRAGRGGVTAVAPLPPVQGDAGAGRGSDENDDDRDGDGDGDDDGDGDEGASPSSLNRYENRTSALKEKRFPDEALERVRLRLRMGSRSRRTEVLIDWLDASILTALRPVEWGAVDLVVREAEVSPQHPYGRMVLLYVINAKATNGRGTGVARTLDLSRFPESQLATVRRHAQRCREWLEAGTFQKSKGRLSTLLRDAVQALWPRADGKGTVNGRHYSMYSCRHQAIANWKALGLPLEEIAAMVGHISTATTTERYGKRRSGWKPERIPVPPSGVPEEVGLVRSRISMFHLRLKQEKDLGLSSEGPTEFII